MPSGLLSGWDNAQQVDSLELLSLLAHVGIESLSHLYAPFLASAASSPWPQAIQGAVCQQWQPRGHLCTHLLSQNERETPEKKCYTVLGGLQGTLYPYPAIRRQHTTGMGRGGSRNLTPTSGAPQSSALDSIIFSIGELSKEGCCCLVFHMPKQRLIKLGLTILSEKLSI